MIFFINFLVLSSHISPSNIVSIFMGENKEEGFHYLFVLRHCLHPIDKLTCVFLLCVLLPVFPYCSLGDFCSVPDLVRRVSFLVTFHVVILMLLEELNRSCFSWVEPCVVHGRDKNVIFLY